MTDETAENETQDMTVNGEAAVSEDHDDDIIEGEIVGGTWINPSIPADDPRRMPQTAQISYTLPEGRPSFVRMVFGSVVIFTEEVTDRASVSAEDGAERQMVEAAIHQAAQQQEALDRKPFADLRYGTIGLLSGVLDTTHGGAGRISGITHAAAQTAGKIIGPVWNSFLFAPFHEPVMRVEKAGESKVDEWIRRGRVEEVRSRALAEVSINNFVEESVTELTENAQVKMIVQEVITSQSTSLASEILKEVRERFVSLDLLLMGKLGRAMTPAPDFRDGYLEELRQRRQHFQYLDIRNSLAGSYAGPVTRLAAFLIDTTILLITVGLISSFVSNALNLFGLTDTVNDFLRSDGLIATITVIVLALINFLLVSSYFIGTWALAGVTVGDAIFGVRVIRTNGKRITFFRSILRLFGMYISTLAFLLGFLWALFDRRRQGWHDKFGDTFVLYDWPAKPEETFLHEQVMEELEEDSQP